jgi:hypothetical protein
VATRQDRVVQVERAGVDRVDEGEGAVRARKAMGTAGVELAGMADEKVSAATPEALEPGAYSEATRRRKTPRHGEAGREVETPAREGERELDALPPEGWRKPEVLPWQGEHEVDDRRKEVRTRANAGVRAGRLEAPPRVDQTEGQVPGDFHLPVTTWKSWRQREETGIKKMKRTLKMLYAPSALRTTSRQ